MSDSPFPGWAVLELMGHRRIAGRLTEQTGGCFAGLLRIDIPSQCAGGAGASWCPVHGTCACPADAKEQPDCPLHGDKSKHESEDPSWAATQFYSSAAVYCITPTTEEIARAVAANSMPEPVHEWELPRKLTAPAPPVVDAEVTDDDEEEEVNPDEMHRFQGGGSVCAVCGSDENASIHDVDPEP